MLLLKITIRNLNNKKQWTAFFFFFKILFDLLKLLFAKFIEKLRLEESSGSQAQNGEC